VETGFQRRQLEGWVGGHLLPDEFPRLLELLGRFDGGANQHFEGLPPAVLLGQLDTDFGLLLAQLDFASKVLP
jgi:hypothetical protein